MSKIQTNQIQHTQNGAAVFTLPSSDGTNGQFLKTNASGTLSFGSGAVTVLLDITDTSNQKVKFNLGAGPSGTPGVAQGDTDRNETTMMFIRIGDT